MNNILLLQTHSKIQQSLSRTMSRLSTGLKLNKGSDNPASIVALANASSYAADLEANRDATVRAQTQATVADGYLSEASVLLTEAKSLAVANAHGGLSAEEQQANQLQIDSILSTVDHLAGNASFNGNKLLDGTGQLSAGGASHTIDSAAVNNIGATTDDFGSYTLADVKSNGAINTVNGNHETAVNAIDQAINDIATERGELGAFASNTLESMKTSYDVSLSSIETTIGQLADANYANEMAQLTRLQMMSRANLQASQIYQSNAESVFSLLSD